MHYGQETIHNRSALVHCAIYVVTGHRVQQTLNMQAPRLNAAELCHDGAGRSHVSVCLFAGLSASCTRMNGGGRGAVLYAVMYEPHAMPCK